MRRVEVTRTYLTLDTPAQFVAASRQLPPGASIERRDPCPVPLYRRLYKEVGEAWYWHSRLEWSDEQLAAHLAAPGVQVWELVMEGEPAGFYELKRHDDGSVEIEYLGLIQRFIGRGLGGMLLSHATRTAFAAGATRVWLHTCTLDSPSALPSYQARGFRPYRTERLRVELEGLSVVSERMLD